MTQEEMRIKCLELLGAVLHEPAHDDGQETWPAVWIYQGETVYDSEIENPLEDANAALRLCGVMEKRGFWPIIERTQRAGKMVWRIVFADSRKEHPPGTSESFAEAICTAALRAEGGGI